MAPTLNPPALSISPRGDLENPEPTKEDTIYNDTANAVADAAIVIVIDNRGVAKLLKHRYGSTNYEVEVKLTRTEPIMERYTSRSDDTLNLASDEEIAQLTSLSKRVAVSPTDVRKMLEDAVATGSPTVLISGSKVSGERFYNRPVQPTWINERGRMGDLVIVRDLQSGERRSFRIDGIERVEAE